MLGPVPRPAVLSKQALRKVRSKKGRKVVLVLERETVQRLERGPGPVAVLEEWKEKERSTTGRKAEFFVAVERTLMKVLELTPWAFPVRVRVSVRVRL